MDWITEDIAIGNYLDGENGDLHRSSGIRSLVCLNNGLRGTTPEARRVDALANFDLKDGPGNNLEVFRRAVESVEHSAKRHPKLVVYCHAGRSRSVVVVAAHLMRARGWTVQEALSFVWSKREAELTPGIELLLLSPFLRDSTSPNRRAQ